VSAQEARRFDHWASLMGEPLPLILSATSAKPALKLDLL
jgi:hypothetical protein